MNMVWGFWGCLHPCMLSISLSLDGLENIALYWNCMHFARNARALDIRVCIMSPNRYPIEAIRLVKFALPSCPIEKLYQKNLSIRYLKTSGHHKPSLDHVLAKPRIHFARVSFVWNFKLHVLSRTLKVLIMLIMLAITYVPFILLRKTEHDPSPPST